MLDEQLFFRFFQKQLLGANKENIPKKKEENARKRGKKGKKKKPVAKDSATNSEGCMPKGSGGSAIMVGPQGISKPQVKSSSCTFITSSLYTFR